ncbi:glutamate receptor ionotropic: kainate 2-like protein, partial [Leptotrombidium deliense]
LTIDENSDYLANGIYKAVKEHNSTHFNTITLRKVIVNETTDEALICSAIFENDIKPSMIIDVTNKRWPATVEIRNLARKLKIATVSTNSATKQDWQYLSMKENQWLLNFKSPTNVFIHAVEDIVHFFGYNKFVVLHDHTFDTDELKSMFAGNETLQIMFKSLENDNISEFETLVRSLRKKRKENLTNFFVLAKPMTINKFMEAITFNDMFRITNNWYFLTKGKGKLRCISCLHATANVIQPVDAYFYYDLTRLILKSVERSYEAVTWIPLKHLESCKNIESHSSRLKHFEGVNLRKSMEEEVEDFHGKFGEFVVNCEGSLESYQSVTLRLSRQVYRRDMKSRKIAEWEYSEPSGNLFFTSADEDGDGEDKPLEEIPEDGILIQVILVCNYLVLTNHPPFVMKYTENSTDGTQKQTVSYYGFLIDLLEYIKAEIPTFPKYIIREHSSGDGLYGHYKTGKDKNEENADGSGGEEDDGEGGVGLPWKGAIKEIYKLKRVLSLGAWTRTYERENLTDFTEPFFEMVGLNVLMKKQKRHIFYYKFVSVLEGSVWLCITGAYFITSILLTLFDKYSPYSYQNNKLKYKDDNEKRIFTFKESLWFCMTSLTPQGGGEAPKSLSGRLVAATWWLFSFIVVASYSANLAAFLTVSRIDNRVTSFYKLTKQYKVRYAPIALSAVETYFNRLAMVEEKFYEVWKDMSLNDSLTEDERAQLAIWDYPISDRFTKIWAQVTEAKAPKSFEEALSRVKNSQDHKEGFALITDSLTVDYFTFTHCDVTKVGLDFSPRPLSLAIGKELKDLKALIDAAIIKLRNNRTIANLKGKWWDWNELRQDCEDQRRLSNGISLRNAGGTFIVFIAGVCATLFAVAVENICIKAMIIRDFKELQFGRREEPTVRRFRGFNCNWLSFCCRKKNR